MEPTGLVALAHGSLVCTRLGLGGGPLGGLFTRVPQDQAEATVEEAWTHGLRLFDVAPLYGHGRAERYVGHVLATKPRDEFVISTKVGRLLRPEAAGRPTDFADTEHVGALFDFSTAGVLCSLEESLGRLGLDRVDIVYIHDPDDHLHTALEEAYPALERLRSERVVRAIGIGTNSAAAATLFARETDIDVVLLANRLTLLDQSGADVAVPLCATRGIDVVAGGVFNSGILAAPMLNPRYEYAPAPVALVRAARELERRCAVHGASLRAAALQFPLRFAGVRAVLIGARAPDEVRANVAAAGEHVPDELWRELERHVGHV